MASELGSTLTMPDQFSDTYEYWSVTVVYRTRSSSSSKVARLRKQRHEDMATKVCHVRMIFQVFSGTRKPCIDRVTGLPKIDQCQLFGLPIRRFGYLNQHRSPGGYNGNCGSSNGYSLNTNPITTQPTNRTFAQVFVVSKTGDLPSTF